ncbi:hypothetical protein JQ631_08555 [Bradyrhizobium manausense]|uniref:hypothetical protein n=1 Tax=Bradyrhizobium manausense TaxID=989370 RepID=UPI001BAD6C27|nr:hypothetical protein [Bradyrhizobium manausense]MBR0789116.1 hypothetical protein [Bradyrhizobium manausense]
MRSRDNVADITTGYDRIGITPEFQDVPLWEKPIDVAAMIRELAGLIGPREV